MCYFTFILYIFYFNYITQYFAIFSIFLYHFTSIFVFIRFFIFW